MLIENRHRNTSGRTDRVVQAPMKIRYKLEESISSNQPQMETIIINVLPITIGSKQE
jgi:hypothetical protein